MKARKKLLTIQKERIKYTFTLTHMWGDVDMRVPMYSSMHALCSHNTPEQKKAVHTETVVWRVRSTSTCVCVCMNG